MEPTNPTHSQAPPSPDVQEVQNATTSGQCHTAQLQVIHVGLHNFNTCFFTNFRCTSVLDTYSAQVLIGEIMFCRAQIEDTNIALEKIIKNNRKVDQNLKNLIDVLGRVLKKIDLDKYLKAKI